MIQLKTSISGTVLKFNLVTRNKKAHLVLVSIASVPCRYRFAKRWDNEIYVEKWFNNRIKAHRNNVRAMLRLFEAECPPFTDEHKALFNTVTNKTAFVRCKVMYHTLQVNGREVVAAPHSSDLSLMREMKEKYDALFEVEHKIVPVGFKSMNVDKTKMDNLQVQTTYKSKGGTRMESRPVMVKHDRVPDHAERIQANANRLYKGQFA
jgi:hypothetical protein